MAEEFTQTFRDADGELITNYDNLTVLETTILEQGMVGEAYSNPISMTGGTGPYVCTLNVGALPDGLSINGDTIEGTPTQQETQTFTLGITDASDWWAIKEFTLEIIPALEIITGE
jgi:hypothetical protein